jgi:oligopeptide transport system substrate-binding protein
MVKFARIGLISCVIGLMIIFCAACQPEQEVITETVLKEVEITRVVTETIEEEGETIVVTRLVTEIIEVEITPEGPGPESQPVTLNWNWGTEPPTADPALATDTTSVDLTSNLFVGLTRFHPATSEVLPYLATAWEAGEDADGYQTWTFHLRDDIAWVNYDPLTGKTTQEVDEDGNPRFVDAHDVVYGVKRTIDPVTGSGYAYVLYIIQNAAAVNGGVDELTLDDVGVVALDDRTVQFTLESPAGFFPSIAGMWMANPMPRWAIEEHEAKWTEAGLIVSNGPYVMESWIHGGELDLVKNPLWVDADSVQIERVDGVIIEEESTSFAMYENDELDSDWVPMGERDRVRADPVLGAEYVNEPVLTTMYIGFVNTKPPFDDARVRRAFTQAIDRQNLIDYVFKGGQIPATSFAPPGVFGAPEPGTVGLSYDPEAARESLDEYLDEKGMTIADFNDLNISAMHWTGESVSRAFEAMQQLWKDTLGVEISVENQEWGVYLDTLGAPVEQVPHIFILGWAADYPDENNWVHEVFNSIAGRNTLRRNCLDPNCEDITTSEFDELTMQALLSQDPEERIRLYYEAERILTEVEVALAPIYHGTMNIVTKPWLTRNFPALSGVDFYNWTIDMAAKLAAQGG